MNQSIGSNGICGKRLVCTKGFCKQTESPQFAYHTPNESAHLQSYTSILFTERQYRNEQLHLWIYWKEMTKTTVEQQRYSDLNALVRIFVST